MNDEKQDEILHRKIGDFMECVHTYDPERHRMPFLEFFAEKLLKDGSKKKKKIRKEIDKRFTHSLLVVSQSEKSADEPTTGHETTSLIERISGSLPDQESVRHRETLCDAFSKHIFTALNQLEAAVIRGIYYRDMSDKEMAKELGKPLTKIRSTERKALRKIRNEIRKQNLFEDLNG